MKKSIFICLILSLILCCTSQQGNVEKIMEDGVEVIINHLEPYANRGTSIVSGRKITAFMNW